MDNQQSSGRGSCAELSVEDVIHHCTYMFMQVRVVLRFMIRQLPAGAQFLEVLMLPCRNRHPAHCVAPSHSPQALCPYNVTVKTGDHKSEFSGGLFISLNGYGGSLPDTKLLLPGGASPQFARGSEVCFTFLSPFLGYLTGCTLRVEPEDTSQLSWNLESVVVDAPSAGERHCCSKPTCPCGMCGGVLCLRQRLWGLGVSGGGERLDL